MINASRAHDDPPAGYIGSTTLYAQAMVADPLSPVGLVFTAGRTLVLGD